MNSRKKASEIVEEVHFDFLNEYFFDMKLVESFKVHFIEKLKGRSTNDRDHFWIWHRNFFFILGKKNGLTLAYIGRCFNKDHATVIHNMIELSNMFEYRNSNALIARKNVADFLKWYVREVNEDVLIKNHEYEAENQSHFDYSSTELIALNQLELNSNYKNGVLPFVGKFDHSTQLATTALSKY